MPDDGAVNPPRRVARVLPSALRTRLAVLFAAAVAVVIAAAVALLAFATDRQFDAAVDTGLGTRTSALVQALSRGDVRVVREDPLAELVDADDVLVDDVTPGPRAAGARREAPFLPPARLAQAREQGSASGSMVVDGQGRVRYTATAVAVPGAGSVLVVGTRMRELDEAEARLVLLFLAGAPVLVASLGAAGWLLAGAALRPVADLTRRAAQISAADVGQRLPQPPGSDEVAVLARTLNRMLDRLEAAVGREREFVDDAAHELRTPIAVLRGELELALRLGDRLPDDVAESLTAALGEAERLQHLAQDLLALASAEHGASARVPVALGALLAREVPRLTAAHPVAVEVVSAEAGDVVVVGDERALSRLLANLVANAEAAGATRVQVRTSAPQDGGAVALVVADDGRGFPEELAGTATERFTRGDAARTRSGGGAGLGLAIVAAVVADHGGTLSLGRDAALGGASVRVLLPPHDRPPPARR